MGKFRFSIDRGGTFTDVYTECPNGEVEVLKLLSEDPAYKDAPTEAIRRIIQEVSYFWIQLLSSVVKYRTYTFRVFGLQFKQHIMIFLNELFIKTELFKEFLWRYFGRSKSIVFVVNKILKSSKLVNLTDFLTGVATGADPTAVQSSDKEFRENP